MLLLRLLLIASVLVVIYGVVLVIFFVPYGWAGVLLLGAVLRRRSTRLHAYGTSRWAQASSDLATKGMIDE
jgi:hypothetical protein